MRKQLRLVIIAALVLVTAPQLSITGMSKVKKRPKDNWVELFNGKDMAGWRQAGKGNFTLEDGALVTHGGMGMLWFEAQKFRDFTLQVEWKVNHRCNNSGIFLRFPDKSDDPWNAVNNGYEIQIDDCDKKGLKYQTGAIYDHHPASKLASKPAGEWNLYEITVVGQHYTVMLNGEKVTEFDGERGREGYIGLQNHDIISRVSFRRVRVKEIRVKETK
jgi:3-keto-disaccharide hydrolase